MQRLAVLAALGLWAVGAAPAQAAATITIKEVGPDVVATFSGALNLDGANPAGRAGLVFSQIVGSFGLLGIAGSYDAVDVSGPLSWGGETVTTPSTTTGSSFLVFGLSPFIGTPVGYVSGTPLSGTMTFANQTLASMSLWQGVYVYSLPNDRLTLDIGGLGAGAVPEPANWAMMIAGFGLVGAAMRQRRSAVAS